MILLIKQFYLIKKRLDIKEIIKKLNIDEMELYNVNFKNINNQIINLNIEDQPKLIIELTKNLIEKDLIYFCYYSCANYIIDNNKNKLEQTIQKYNLCQKYFCFAYDLL
jgi:hypothetical protein